MTTYERFTTFVKDVRAESKKVTWPTREELYESTMVVIVTVAIISAFIFVVDQGMQTLVRLVLR